MNVFTVALADSGYPLLFFLVFFLGFKFAVFYALDHLFGRFSFFSFCILISLQCVTLKFFFFDPQIYDCFGIFCSSSGKVNCWWDMLA